MPDTWTPIFNLCNKEKVQQINDNAEPEMDYIIKQIKNFVAGDFMKNKLPYPLAKIGYNIEYDSMRKTKHFRLKIVALGVDYVPKTAWSPPLSSKTTSPNGLKNNV